MNYLAYLRSKTLWFGTALTIASLVQIAMPYFPMAYAAQAGAVVGVIVIVLRFLTTVPVSEK